MLTTSRALVLEMGPCASKYKKASQALTRAGYKGQKTHIPLSAILQHAGLEAALWALIAVPIEQVEERDKIARLLVADYAERVLPLYEARCPGDSRPRQAIQAARDFVNGKIDRSQLATAWVAASTVAWAVAWATSAVGSAAARDAASTAPWAVGSAVARDAASAVAWAVAWDAERKWQADRLQYYLSQEVMA